MKPKYVLSLILLAAVALSGCASKPVTATIAVKPSLAPVTKSISEARSAVSVVEANVTDATARASRASEIARDIVATGVEPHSLKANELVSEVDTLRSALFRSQAALREVNEKLAESDLRIAESDEKIAKQTDELNQCRADLTEARAEIANLKERVKVADRERAAAQRSLWWAKAQKWLVGGGLVALFVGAYALKFIGAGARLAV